MPIELNAMDPTAIPTCDKIGLPVKLPLISDEVIVPVVDIPLFEAGHARIE